MMQRQYHFAILGGATAGLFLLSAAKHVSAQAAAANPTPPGPTSVNAQAAPEPAVAAVPSETKTDASATPTKVETATEKPPAERLAALEEKQAAQANRIQELEGTISAFSTQLSEADNESAEDRRLSAWGFFDVTFGRALYDNPNALYAVGTPGNWSFMSNGINLYLKSQMTSTLSTMIETRLTYTPVGSVESMPTNVYIGGQRVATNGEFVRAAGASEYHSPYSYFRYRQHGLFIERAHVDWKPKDWFGVRLGRYLTPFGIWNEDHGSPVVLGIDMPNLINYAMVPTHQMGLQLFGNRLLTESLNFEYAVTLSNGRGPIDEFQDLDNNKAVGLRAKLVYAAGDLLLRLGGYAYYGKYTDRDFQINVWLTPTSGLDRSQAAPMGSSSTVTRAYRETIGTLDAMVQFKGLKIMAEMAQRKVVYDVAPPLASDSAALSNVPFGLAAYAASYTGYAYYVLAGYEFDLGQALANVKVTPYAGADRLSPDQTLRYMDMDQYRMGLNIKPSPYVTAKLEAMRAVPKADETASKFWLLAAQAAVSF